jgi:acetyl esterase/lipase
VGALQTIGASAIGFATIVSVPLRRAVRGPKRPGWDLRTELAATLMRRTMMSSKRLGLGWLRAVLAGAPVPSPLLDEVRLAPVDAGGVPARWCEPREGGASRTLVYLHGGGYVMGSPHTHREAMARLALGVGARVLGVDYRLSPEHRFPAAQDDCLAATRWLLGEGVDPAGLALAGDSAGGGLCLATLTGLRDAGDALPAAAFLISPWTAPLAKGGSMEANEPYDFGDRDLLVGWALDHAPGGAARDPRVSVLDAKLDGLPPLLVQVGSAELLLDQDLAFVERARAAGVEVELQVFDDLFHDFQLFASVLPEGAAAMETAARWLRGRLAG